MPYCEAHGAFKQVECLFCELDNNRATEPEAGSEEDSRVALGSAPTDAELLDWIEHNLLRVEWSRDWPGRASWAVVKLNPQPYDFVSLHVLGRGDTIREAITEAMGPN